MNTLFDMSRETVLITGGGTGLGKQFAKTLAGAGARVILACVVGELHLDIFSSMCSSSRGYVKRTDWFTASTTRTSTSLPWAGTTVLRADFDERSDRC